MNSPKILCNHCGKVVDADLVFCNYCGGRLESELIDESDDKPNVDMQEEMPIGTDKGSVKAAKWFDRFWWRLLFLFVGVLVVSVLLYAFGEDHDANRAKYMLAIIPLVTLSLYMSIKRTAKFAASILVFQLVLYGVSIGLHTCDIYGEQTTYFNKVHREFYWLTPNFVIPNGVTEISRYAFNGCSSLKSITIPESVAYIGEDAFAHCRLNDVHISNLSAWCNVICEGHFATNPLSMAENLYLNGELVTDLIIPSDVTEIKKNVFDYNNLKSVTIHNNVTEIGSCAFGGSYSSLSSVHISDLDAWCRIEFEGEYANPLTYAHNLYLNGELVTELTIPDGIIAIKDYVFSGCHSLKSVNMNDVVRIGEGAFKNCENLDSVSMKTSSGISEIGNYAFAGCKSLKDITIHSRVDLIGEGAFSYCTNLENITISDGVREIGECAFEYCRNLRQAKMFWGFTLTKDHAFRGCSKLIMEYPWLERYQ